MTQASVGLTISQQRALSDMGIEVWVRRDGRGHAANDAVAAATSERVSKDRAAVVAEKTRSAVGAAPARLRARETPAKPAERSSTIPSNDSPVGAKPDDVDFRAELDCVAVDGVVLVGRWHNPLDKRLAHDIAVALATLHQRPASQSADLQQKAAQDGVPPPQPKVQQTAFRWPATQTGDRSVAAARNAFRAFLRGQAERAHARCVVLFGDAAAELADDLESQSLPPTLRQPAIGALRADPNVKKALWLNASQNALG
ncbi:MAG TPA: hypothetical protein VFG38_13415 [Pseudomonadales bacterium]|nr:hypothetical protein [Pseudomonadales bacterium]